ncbi:MAG TPA: RHS repeat-associated core domain-containing protein [Pyrinomonadaceae bacterium]|nr:RHS repeat-associated core domain-containing protein [Pyrinomonadaceae bacterium]
MNTRRPFLSLVVSALICITASSVEYRGRATASSSHSNKPGAGAVFGDFRAMYAPLRINVAMPMEDDENQPPVAVSDGPFTVHGASSVIGPTLGNDYDPEGDSFVMNGVVTPTAHGQITNIGGGYFVYYPAGGYVGPDSFTYNLWDLSQKFSEPATVTLNTFNRPPMALTDFYSIDGVTTLGPLKDNDFDPDDDEFFVDGVITQPRHGQAALIGGGGLIRYYPEEGFSGIDSFTYRIFDYGLSAIGTVYVTIGGEDGEVDCKKGAGKPVNITNGNMYLKQTDYALPNTGPALAVTRTYNSNSKHTGLFGRGWTSAYDEAVNAYDSNMVQLAEADGRATYFGRTAGPDADLVPLQTDFHGSLIKGANNDFVLTLKDGSAQRFNADGKLISIADRVGNQTSLNYDSGGRLASATDSFGRTLSFSTNASGQVLSIADAMGTIATYTYGADNQLLSVTYADSSAFLFIYDGNLRLTTVTDALGNVRESHQYDSQGRALTSESQGGVERYSFDYVSESETDVTDALGHISKYFFDTSKSRNVVTRIEGLCSCGSGSQAQTWDYDDNLNVISTTNSLNQVTSYTFDAQGNELTTTDATGTTTKTYNQFGEVLTITDALGAVTYISYNDQGTPLAITDPLNHTTTYNSNSLGQLVSVTDARGKMTSFAYDHGNLVTSTDALGHTSEFAYDTRGRLQTATNALGHATTFAYDAVGRVLQVTTPDGSVVSYEYDQLGRRSAMTDARGNRSTFAYDGAYRLISQTDVAGQTTAFGYDGMSNLTSVADALARTTNYEYDDFNRPVKTIFPPATPGGVRLFESVSYDAIGNVKQRTDTAGRVIRHVYDDANRLIQTTDADSRTTGFEYDSLSRMTALVDALGQRYRFNYDSVGRLRHLRRGASVMSFTYDAVGNRKHRTDYNGALTVYNYDALNRLKTITYSDATSVSYTYDKLSRLQTATNESGTIDFNYNQMNRLTNVTDVFGQEVDYHYDQNGNRTKLSLNAVALATYRYDVLNRLTKLLDASGAAFTYDYDALSRLTQQKAPNGLKTNYQYDGMDRLARLLDSKGATTIADRQYQYNSANQITQIAEPATTRNYSYDALDRLVTASYSSSSQPNETYAYDAIGNRTSSHLSTNYSYQPFNRLSNTSSANYSYDANGNLLLKSEAGGTTFYSWDFENRLKQVTLPNGNRVAYKYDALGRRIQRVPNAGVSTNFIYDGQDVIKDINSDGSTVDYMNGPGIDNKLRLSDSRLSAGPLYFLQDHLGSTTKLTNSAGAVVEQDTYNSFGKSAGSPLTRYSYTGRERDPDTGLMYYRARWYDPDTGRFISEDPIGLAGGINQYAYVSNNPLNGTDPTGLYEIDVHYYLTYFLALKTGCFDSNEARLIADADQSTDENGPTSPGPGWSEQQRRQNRDNHDLQPGNHEGQMSPELWRQAMTGRTNYVGLGQALHFLQDSFSHAGFESDMVGHLSRIHYYDKTDSDAPRALRMAAATWGALNEYAKVKKCGCQGKWDPLWWQQVIDFSNSPGANFGLLETIDSNGELDNFGMTNAQGYLMNKIRILGLTPR